MIKRLEKSDLAGNPVDQFAIWFEQAAGIGLLEPSAMVLSTASTEGKPSSRTVLLKSFDKQGFVFYTNYGSRKARELDTNPFACLHFYWEKLGFQILIEGKVSRVSRKESERYFVGRDRQSRVGAWASRQSQVIDSREVLENRYGELSKKFGPDSEIPLPEFWGGYRLLPEVFEFWKSGEHRLHDRFRYRLDDNGEWLVERLSP